MRFHIDVNSWLRLGYDSFRYKFTKYCFATLANVFPISSLNLANLRSTVGSSGPELTLALPLDVLTLRLLAKGIEYIHS